MEVQQQRDQAEFEEDMLKTRRKRLETAYGLRKDDRQRRMRRKIAEQRVMFGASGVQIDPTVFEDTADVFAREQFQDNFQLNQSLMNIHASIKNARASKSNAIRSGILNFSGDIMGLVAGIDPSAPDSSDTTIGAGYGTGGAADPTAPYGTPGGRIGGEGMSMSGAY